MKSDVIKTLHVEFSKIEAHYLGAVIGEGLRSFEVRMKEDSSLGDSNFSEYIDCGREFKNKLSEL